MSDQASPQKRTGFQLDRELLEKSVVHANVAQDIVITTADKIRLCLRDHQDALKARTDWIARMGIFIALVAALVTSHFRACLGLNPQDWKVLFTVGALIAAVWLVYAVIRAIRLRGCGIEHIVQELKRGSPVPSSEE